MTVVVTSKHDLVVPKSVRRKAGIKSGDRVEFTVSPSLEISKCPPVGGVLFSEFPTIRAGSKSCGEPGKLRVLQQAGFRLEA